MLTSLILALIPVSTGTVEKEAILKASEAAYIQTGIAAEVHRTQSQASEFARRQANLYGIGTYVGVAGGIVQAVRTRSATARLSTRSLITLHTDSVSMTFTF